MTLRPHQPPSRKRRCFVAILRYASKALVTSAWAYFIELSKPSHDEKSPRFAGKRPYVTVRGSHFGSQRVVVHLEWNPKSIYPIDQ